MEGYNPDTTAIRLRGLLVVVCLLFVVLFLRLFQLQIAAGEDYARESENNRINPKRVKARSVSTPRAAYLSFANS